nr:copper amine oxidase N-terminal domain-containing protein [uncultured Niameybacter sp.]
MKRICILAVSVIMLLFWGRQTYGCFAYIEPEVVIREADVIMLIRVIGEKGMINETVVTGRKGEERTLADTEWNVEVIEVFKDVTGGKEIKIATEGSKLATSHMSTEFSLEEYGEYMLICLDEESSGYFYPRTPSSIIPLKSIDRNNLDAVLHIDNVNKEKVDVEEHTKFVEALNRLCIQKDKNEPTYLFRIGDGDPYEAEGFIQGAITYIGLTDFGRVCNYISSNWDEKNKQIVVSGGGQILKLKPNELQANINGKKVALTHAPIIKDGKTYLPVKTLAQLLGIEMKFERVENMYYYTLKFKEEI